MPRGIVIEIIGDERSYLRAAEGAMAANTKLDASFKSVAVSAARSAEAQVAAAVKSQEAMRANVAALGAAAARSPVGSKEQTAALALQAEAQAKLNRSLGISSVATSRFGANAKTAERDVNKMTRGVLSGSGILGRFSRSLAFASTGFIAFATAAEVIKQSITSAEDLEKAQRSLGVAIRHTGGNVGQLLPKYTATARAAAEFGVSQAAATTGLARATVLTGNAAAAQRAYQEALLISKATGKDFNIVLTAAAKGQEGITTSLRRYGILVDSTSSGQEQFNQVMKRFGGQAAANTTELDKLKANLTNTAAEIGKVLLPTFNRLVGSLSAWLTKMNESGRLQKDVNRTLHDAGVLFHALVAPIKLVDKLTGSFANTLKLLVGIKLGLIVAGWVGALDKLAAGWIGVAGAANGAAAAQTKALASAGGAGAAGAGVAGVEAAAGAGLVGGLAARRAAAQAAKSEAAISRISKFTGTIAPVEGEVAAVGAAAVVATGKVAALRGALSGLGALTILPIAIPIVLNIEDRIRGKVTQGLQGVFGRGQTTSILKDLIVPHSLKDFLGVSLFNDIFRFKSDAQRRAAELADQIATAVQNRITQKLSHAGATRFQPAFAPPPGFGLGLRTGTQSQGFDAGVKPMKQFFQKFELTFKEQLAQVQSSLTRSSADDVAAARQVVARIKRLIDQGRLHGQGLVQALGLEASALQTIWAAEDAAAQKRAQRAQAAKARIQKQIEDSIDPLRLEVALSQAQALGKPFIGILKQLREAARKAIASGKLTLEQQKEAWDQIASLNQQIKDAISGETAQFQVPARLALRLARDTALGRDTTKDLLSIRKAILRFIATHKHNLAALTDAYNQLADINQQLASSAQSALGLFKQASTRALTEGLGLTPEQRKRLRARLSQLGPGGTVPGEGVGAAGFVIGPNGRPIQVHGRGATISARDSQTVSPARFNRLIRVLERVAERPVRVVVDLDGRIIADNTTRHQQRRRDRNSAQRRGPAAGVAGG